MARNASQSVHCLNCGAPAIPLLAPGAAFCPYCGAHQVAKAGATSRAGVQIRHADSGVDCPVCAIELHEAIIAELPARLCTRCGGMLCAMEHFAQIVQTRRAEFAGADSPPRALNHAELARSMRCPRCRATMETHPYGGGGGVVIDTCVPCGEVWLDAGELTALERAPGRR